MAETAVYQFTWWDRHASKEIVSSRFATLEAIARCYGKAIEASRLVVTRHAGMARPFSGLATIAGGFI
jgi:hypothetical protein